MKKMDSFGGEAQTRQHRTQMTEASSDLDSGDESGLFRYAWNQLLEAAGARSRRQSTSSWRPPKLSVDPELSPESKEHKLVETNFEFRPTVKEADPIYPEPDPTIKKEEIECHRFELSSWNRLRYKEAEKSFAPDSRITTYLFLPSSRIFWH